MIDLAIYGAGGFGRETKFLVERINAVKNTYVLKGYIDDFQQISERVESYQAVAIAIADPGIRRSIFEKLESNITFPSIIHPDVFIDKSVIIGKGCIVCSGVKLTIDISLGDFTILNLNSTIGHDVNIGSFCSIMPSVNIGGNVSISDGVYVGSAATILPGLTIGWGSIIGAGAVVTKDIPPQTTAKGVPARFN